MRISDWSSDVCSSDLSRSRTTSPASRRTSAPPRPSWASTPTRCCANSATMTPPSPTCATPRSSDRHPLEDTMKLDTDKMLAEQEGAIGWVTFNNPARRNALSLDMWQAPDVILACFQADPAIRAVVMKGAGDKAFVSGADISQFAEKRADAEAAAAYAKTSEAARQRLSGITKPLIGMIRGFCMGGGLGIAMKADVRIASDDSVFAIPAARLSIAYGLDNVGDLVSRVGPSYATDIQFSARRLTAAAAVPIGLANPVLAGGAPGYPPRA